ncbi:MAG: FliI/YscN family ATPase [Phycisphaerae bacterium]|nr:FliI/YscN family ATPase [Phycisphaerae bacterium]
MSVLAEQIETARRVSTLAIEGRVASAAGLTIQAKGIPAPVGSMCEIITGPDRVIRAEVIGFQKETTLLMPLSEIEGLASGQRVRHVTSSQKVPVGPSLLGRVVNAMGVPMDGGGPLSVDSYYPLHRPAPEAMGRPRIDAPLSVGIRSINALTTIGLGQRVGVFAGTGVGKSVLLGMMARYTSADVCVIALVGERGRELQDFIAKDLGTEGMRRSVVVVATSDESPPMRLRATFAATAVAEYFRDQGANVLLLVDSITRMAMAARQIGLAAGEPPATKGYPPSVFAAMPRLLERSGRTEQGSITGLYTVLVEGDDLNDPVSDAARGILDGHIVLSRKLANRGLYPAVSVLDSISRVMTDVVNAEHVRAAQRVKRMMAVWDEIEDLVNIGAYAAGTNPEFDMVIRMRPALEEFMRQDVSQGVDSAAAAADLLELSARMDESPAKVTSEPGGPGRGVVGQAKAGGAATRVANANRANSNGKPAARRGS